jgi:hypothetical protein
MANGYMFLTAGVLYLTAGGVAVAGCGDVGADLVTCGPSLLGAAVIATGATISATAGVLTFKDATLPAFKEWGFAKWFLVFLFMYALTDALLVGFTGVALGIAMEILSSPSYC